jgi:hypothetical protein
MPQRLFLRFLKKTIFIFPVATLQCNVKTEEFENIASNIAFFLDLLLFTLILFLYKVDFGLLDVAGAKIPKSCSNQPNFKAVMN